MKITIEKEIIITRLDDEIAMLNKLTGKYFSLNKSGARVWELLQQYKETEKVFNIMLDEYDVDKDVLMDDINRLVAGLVDSGLVKPA